MKEYYEEIRERKSVARAARSVKRGSKSRKCPLPSDRMTRKDWEKMNGEIKSYDMGKRMGWKEFKAMPEDLRKQYLERLQRMYGAHCVAIGDMMGVTANTVRVEARKLGVKFSRSNRMTHPKLLKMWEEFAHPSLEAEQEPVEEETALQVGTLVEKSARGPAQCLSGSVTYTGSIGAAMRTLYSMLGETRCRCTINWEVEEDG